MQAIKNPNNPNLLSQQSKVLLTSSHLSKSICSRTRQTIFKRHKKDEERVCEDYEQAKDGQHEDYERNQANGGKERVTGTDTLFSVSNKGRLANNQNRGPEFGKKQSVS